MEICSRSASRPAFFRRWVAGAASVGAVVVVAGCQAAASETADATMEAAGTMVMAGSPEDAGRYIVNIAGCNDCHTDRFMELGTAIPESERLTGSNVGFRGPWGTTYPPNLRLSVQSMTEDQWVEMLGTRTGLPPMPWPSVSQMSEGDRRAVYRYLRSLGAAGSVVTAALAPGVEPTGPWIDFDVHGLEVAVAAD